MKKIPGTYLKRPEKMVEIRDKPTEERYVVRGENKIGKIMAKIPATAATLSGLLRKSFPFFLATLAMFTSDQQGI